MSSKCGGILKFAPTGKPQVECQFLSVFVDLDGDALSFFRGHIHMPAYARFSLGQFLSTDPKVVSGTLHAGYANDGFVSQYTQQTKSWEVLIPLLQAELQQLAVKHPEIANWGILLEYPLYRLRKRIDVILLAANRIIVVEAKVGERTFRAEDERQVEDYALDLRDFHAGSRANPVIPLLWCTSAPSEPHTTFSDSVGVGPVHRSGEMDLHQVLQRYVASNPGSQIRLAEWDAAPYQPVPTIVQAATSIFAGHDVKAISRADASNLAVSARRILELIEAAKSQSRKTVAFLTGVPGAGKTLAGLQVVHDAIATGQEDKGDIIYLSGNTPLVVVLREALARDTVERERVTGKRMKYADARRNVRTRIQHITDFLKQYLTGTGADAPHEHAIVFDEAQRAWNAEQGAKKFSRDKSEPSLLLDIMGRHEDWCVCVCLVGGGQEINTGEEGIRGWGDAIRALPASEHKRWTIAGPEDVFQGGTSTGGLSLGEIPGGMIRALEPDLRLTVPLRSFRSPIVSDWVGAVLDADLSGAKAKAKDLGEFPIVLTRSLERARMWLRERGRGQRRYGLLASSGARRLRADGLGVFLAAGDGDSIAHWYLNARDDIRSSYVLEVPANEYACQGLEIDHAGICWGGDLVYACIAKVWRCRKLSGNSWKSVGSDEVRRYIRNKYRVLMTRAREGLVIWVPRGDQEDKTRTPQELDATADFLTLAGAQLLDIE
jgi:hypothetical protein